MQLGCYTFVNPPSGHQRTLSGPRPDHAYPDRAAPRRFSEMPKGRSWLAQVPFAGGGACDLRSLTRPLVPVGLSPSYLPCSSMPDRSLVEVGRCSRRPLPRFEKTEREGAVSPSSPILFCYPIRIFYVAYLCQRGTERREVFAAGGSKPGFVFDVGRRAEERAQHSQTAADARKAAWIWSRGADGQECHKLWRHDWAARVS